MVPAGQIAAAADRAGEASVRLEIVSPPDQVRALVRPAAAVAALTAEWSALAAAASEPNAFAEPWFVVASLATLTEGRDIRLIEVRRANRLIGILPVAVERGYARLPVRFVQNWHHDQMFLGTPLVRAGEEAAFWTAAILALDEAGWAGNFLHVRGIAEDGPVHRGLAEAARNLGRGCATVHRRVRAFLQSDLAPAAYYERAVRHKKRKEIRRLRKRLGELGAIVAHVLDDAAALGEWCDTYLALEEAGWKGKAGSALACRAATERFFRGAVKAAWDAGKLQFLRLDVGERTVAMLVNFLTPPGGFTFKTVFDEDYARFSPGVLVQIENLRILERPDIAWMDSCALDHHPMIDALWTERRTIVRATVPLRGARRSAIFALCRALELGSARFRKLLK